VAPRHAVHSKIRVSVAIAQSQIIHEALADFVFPVSLVFALFFNNNFFQLCCSHELLY